MSDPDCAFCEIVRDRSLACVVIETADVIAFLDRMPLTRGHLLVIPRRHAQTLADLPPGDGARLGAALPALCSALCKAVGAADYNVICNNGERAAQTVPHVHFHIVPRVEGAQWNAFGRGPRTEELDDEEGAQLAAAIRKELDGMLWRAHGVPAARASPPVDAPPHERRPLDEIGARAKL